MLEPLILNATEPERLLLDQAAALSAQSRSTRPFLDALTQITAQRTTNALLDTSLVAEMTGTFSQPFD
jgi:hypothetical protein